jgi:hypothetical protein
MYLEHFYHLLPKIYLHTLYCKFSRVFKLDKQYIHGEGHKRPDWVGECQRVETERPEGGRRSGRDLVT